MRKTIIFKRFLKVPRKYKCAITLDESEKVLYCDSTVYHMETKSIYESLSQLQSPQDIEKALQDLCTPKELQNMEERWIICQLLHQKKSYREVHRICGSSLTTITRVARFLTDTKTDGYNILLKKNFEEYND